jgi:hypothetical protein
MCTVQICKSWKGGYRYKRCINWEDHKARQGFITFYPCGKVSRWWISDHEYFDEWVSYWLLTNLWNAQLAQVIHLLLMPTHFTIHIYITIFSFWICTVYKPTPFRKQQNIVELRFDCLENEASFTPIYYDSFRSCPDWPWGPPSLLYNGYRVSFLGVKRPGHGVDHPPPSSARVKERVELYLYSSSGPSWSVLGRTLPYLTFCIYEHKALYNTTSSWGWACPLTPRVLMPFLSVSCTGVQSSIQKFDYLCITSLLFIFEKVSSTQHIYFILHYNLCLKTLFTPTNTLQVTSEICAKIHKKCTLFWSHYN